MYNNIFAINEKPQTIYAILNSIVNFNAEKQTKIVDLAKAGRTKIFDFDYPLTTKIKKEDFEVMILNKFLMRRIGFETVTAFKIQLCVKLNEIMPNYNMMFDAMEGWDLFQNGEVTTRDLTDNRTSQNSGENTSTSNSTSTSKDDSTADMRHSDTPQNRLQDVKDGNYVTDYNYNTNNSNGSASSDNSTTQNITSNASDNQILKETITKNQGNRIEVYKSFVENKNNIYSMIFSDLNNLFYGLI